MLNGKWKTADGKPGVSPSAVPCVRESGVRVTCVSPGFVKSEMTAKNEVPMPFLMETDAAVELMGQGILRGDTELAFPWQLALPWRLVKVLPNPLFDAASRRLR